MIYDNVDMPEKWTYENQAVIWGKWIFSMSYDIQLHCTLGWGDFLQKHTSYCGNLGMTHKDEKWQK